MMKKSNILKLTLASIVLSAISFAYGYRDGGADEIPDFMEYEWPSYKPKPR